MSEGKHEIDYERSDVSPGPVVNVGLLVALVTILACVAALGLLDLLSDRARKAEPPNPPLARHEQGRTPPEPRLQVQPFQDVAALKAEEREFLEGAAWVDEKAGIARIPVEAALEIVAETGLPRWAPAASPSPAPPPEAPARPEAKAR